MQFRNVALFSLVSFAVAQSDNNDLGDSLGDIGDSIGDAVTSMGGDVGGDLASLASSAGSNIASLASDGNLESLASSAGIDLASITSQIPSITAIAGNPDFQSAVSAGDVDAISSIVNSAGSAVDDDSPSATDASEDAGPTGHAVKAAGLLGAAGMAGIFLL